MNILYYIGNEYIIVYSIAKHYSFSIENTFIFNVHLKW